MHTLQFLCTSSSSKTLVTHHISRCLAISIDVTLLLNCYFSFQLFLNDLPRYSWIIRHRVYFLSSLLFYIVCIATLQTSVYNLSVVSYPLSLSSPCVTQKMAVRDPGGEKHASRPQDFTRPFFFAVFFRVTHDELSERGTARSLSLQSGGITFHGDRTTEKK